MVDATVRGASLESRRAFHLEEYRQLRAESAALLARIELLFRYSLIVSATVFAWMIVQSFGANESGRPCLKLPSVVIYGWAIPPAFVFISTLMAFAAYWRIRQMGQYMARLEATLGRRSFGWERFLKPKKPIVTGTTAGVWAILFAVSLFGAYEGIGLTRGDISVCKAETSNREQSGR